MGLRLLLLVATVAATLLPSAIDAGIYIVRMRGESLIMYSGSLSEFARTAPQAGEKLAASSEAAMLYKSYLTARHDELLELFLVKGSYNKLYSYCTLVNAFSVQITEEQAEQLAQAPGVVGVEKDILVHKRTTHTPDFLGLYDGVWARTGGWEGAGDDIVIGVVDTGIDPSHPSFSSETELPYKPLGGYRGTCEVAKEFPSGSCNNKIVGARHFAAAAIAGGEFNASVDYASPFDADGHGSHTAATAAGNHGVPVTVKGYTYGYASGMAPRARIAVYKALYPFGGFLSDVVAAIDQAVQDGVDVLSLSLGPDSPPAGVSTFLSVFDVELLFAVKAGIFVTQAAGNSGPALTSILSFSPWITSVSASLTDRAYSNVVTLGSSLAVKGVGLSPPTSGKFTIVSAVDAFTGNSSFINVDECQQPAAYNRDLIVGKILLCVYSFSFQFGSASIKQVAQTAEALGAEGFILVSDPALGTSSKAEPTPLHLPGIIITDLNSSLEVLDYYNKSTSRYGNGVAKWFGASGEIADGRSATYGLEAPVVAAFSSRGPDIYNSQSQVADVLKPDIMAPGYLIWSAWSPTGVDESNFYGERFAMLSGTSMATPHIAGIAALLKQAYPWWSPAAITSAMMTTASVYDHQGKLVQAQNPVSNLSTVLGPAVPFEYGAGAVNPTAALDPGLVFDTGFEEYVNFLCSVPGVDLPSVRDATGSPCTSPLAWASDLNKPYITVANLIGTRPVLRKVTNVATQTETYTAEVDQPTGVIVTISPWTFTIKVGETVALDITLKATISSPNVFNFGAIGLHGSLGHYVRIALAVSPDSAVS